MPYTNGIFYIDPATGNDAARTALTGCIASNPSGTITRINRTAHGLTTGAIVDLTLFSAWLNAAFKITVVDADNFDLDNTVWQTTADNNGTVTPRGGSSWTDAWQSLTNGATAARTEPSDTIRVAETAPVSTGINATFTNNSRNITLASALTKTIHHANGIAVWTASANITLGNVANTKYGTANSIQVTPATAFVTGKVVYAAIHGGGTQDFSAYNKISFWFRPTNTTIIAANTYKICLCSDTTGDTIVDEFNIPATLGNISWNIFTVNKGSALGNNIQSVAIYANSDPGTTPFSFSNIVACNDVTHETLIGWENDCFYSVRNFDGTTIEIDSNNNTTGGRGWSGTTGTATLYYMIPFTTRISTTANLINDSGNELSLVTYTGGWNKTSNTRTGYTAFASNLVGQAIGLSISSVNFANIENFILARYGAGISATAPHLSTLNNIIICGGGNSNSIAGPIKISKFKYFNNSGSISFNTVFIYDSEFRSNTTQHITALNIKCIKCIFSNVGTNTLNPTSSFGLGGLEYSGTSSSFYKCNVLDINEMSTGAQSAVNNFIWSYEHDQTANNHWGWTYQATINWQTSVKQVSDLGSWRVVHNGIERTSDYPVKFEFARVAVEANKLVTVKAWIKKDHATNVGCRISVEGADFTLTGITATSVTAANNTNWQELTITFTPTVEGVVPIWFESFYISGNSNTYIGSITVTQ